MIDESLVYELREYFPIMIKSKTETEYIDEHFSLLAKCLSENLFQDAFWHLHLLYMSFVYFQIFRIKLYKNKDFRLGCIGFSNQRNDLEDATSPFTFSIINEKSIFRFFRLVGFEDNLIGSIAKCVEDRNNFTHANGILAFQSEEEFVEKFENYKANLDNICKRQTEFILDLYDGFSRTKRSEFQYLNIEDEIRENFIASALISEKELIIIFSHRPTSKYFKELKKMYSDIYESSKTFSP